MTDNRNFVRKRRYPKDVLARMGHRIYEDKIRSLVEDGNVGKMAAIDVDNGNYEVGYYWQMLECTDRLFDKNPDAQILAVNIGKEAMPRLSWRLMKYYSTTKCS